MTSAKTKTGELMNVTQKVSDGWLDSIGGSVGARGAFAFLWSAGLGILFAFLVPSRTLGAFIGVGSAVGSVVGLRRARLIKKGLAKTTRLSLNRKYLIGFGINVLVGVLLLWIIRPETAVRFDGFLESARDFLEDPAYYRPINWLAMLLAAIGSYLFVYGLCLLSPKLDRGG
jgi:hypothetical protein